MTRSPSTFQDSPITVPARRLIPDVLEGLVEEFVLREGTDYGHSDHALAAKRAVVVRQIEQGEVIIVYDAGSRSCNLVLSRDLPQP